ncbi:MAG: hypothetical protein V1702_01010 [Candidatus Woesearchaeota archaeon]
MEGTRKCAACGEPSPFNEMRYNKTGTKFICAKCIEKERGGFIPGTTQTGSVKIQKQQFSEKTQ